MIKYMKSKNAGKVVEWETVIRSGMSVPVITAIAKSMVSSINNDIYEIYKPDEDMHDASSETRPTCDVSGIRMYPDGNYIRIVYSIAINTMSLKMMHRLKELGVVTVEKEV